MVHIRQTKAKSAVRQEMLTTSLGETFHNAAHRFASRNAKCYKATVYGQSQPQPQRLVGILGRCQYVCSPIQTPLGANTSSLKESFQHYCNSCSSVCAGLL